MIFDRLANARLYTPLGPGIARALDYLRQTDLACLTPGRYEIDGATVYALVSEYATKDRLAGRWEAHRRYIDLQCLVRGTERIGYAALGRMREGEYDEQKDLVWLEGDGELLTLEPGSFVLMWPHDAHMPAIAAGEPAPVKKIVVKIAV